MTGRRRLELAIGLGFLTCLWPVTAGAQIEYYHLDALGSVRVVTNQAGQVVRRHDYQPFGEETGGSATQADPRMFTGKERDTDTALDYFGARYYRASFGRFTTVDPVQTTAESLVDPQRWNRYAYVRNNPLSFVDPDGRLIVHLWRYRGKSEAWGHASITLDDGTHISWWPRPEGRIPGKISANLYTADAFPDQSLSDDTDFEGQRPDLEIRITGLDEKAIRAWWYAFRRTHKWNTTGPNCSTVAAGALGAGGANVKWSDFFTQYNVLWTPADVEAYAKAVKAYQEEKERKRKEEEERQKHRD